MRGQFTFVRFYTSWQSGSLKSLSCSFTCASSRENRSVSHVGQRWSFVGQAQLHLSSSQSSNAIRSSTPGGRIWKVADVSIITRSLGPMLPSTSFKTSWSYYSPWTNYDIFNWPGRRNWECMPCLESEACRYHFLYGSCLTYSILFADNIAPIVVSA